MGAYSAILKRTAHASQSVGTITADATRPRRLRIFDWMFGCEGDAADNEFLWTLSRVTAAGTAGSAVTPKPLDPGDPATEQDAGQAHSAEPTYTANETLLSIPLNQRGSFRWVAVPGFEIVTPATAANGIGIMTPTMTALAITTTVHFIE